MSTGACRVPNATCSCRVWLQQVQSHDQFSIPDNFETGKILEPDTWFKPADFGGDHIGEIQADELYGHDIASFFLRFESGQSLQYCFNFTQTFQTWYVSMKYQEHGGTNEKTFRPSRGNRAVGETSSA